MSKRKRRSLKTKARRAGIDRQWLRDRSYEEGNCWIWCGASGESTKGYPQVLITSEDIGSILVRRLAAAIGGKDVKFRQPIRMTCGVKRCVNPEHCKVSSNKEISRIAAKRGTFSSVTKSAKIAATMRKNSKISDQDVRAIREAPKGEIKKTCERLGISYSTGRAIRSGRIRKDYTNIWRGLM